MSWKERCCCGVFSDLTWDNTCSYSTAKVAEIQDRRLGFLYYTLIFLVALYTLGFVVLYEQRYLLLQAPVGSVRLSLLSPQNNGNQLPPSADSLPYCAQSGQSYYHGFPTYECQYWDESFAVFPIVEETAMFISTRVTNETETLPDDCSLTVNTCNYELLHNNTLFIANIEQFTLLIDHSFYAGEVGIRGNSQDYPGVLLNKDGKQVQDDLKPPNQVGKKGQPDILTIQTVLSMAGIDSLDNPSSADRKRSIRDDGIVILVFITYTNTYTYNTGKVRYEYEFVEVPDTKFKAVQPIFTKNIQNRMLWNRHGIRLIFRQTGLLGEFDFQTLLLSFISGLGLVAVVGLIIDYAFIRYCSPIRKLYRKEKYIETPEWSELRKHPFESINDGEVNAQSGLMNNDMLAETKKLSQSGAMDSLSSTSEDEQLLLAPSNPSFNN
eukprot:CAMPEP_0201546620 /NCGR_PEP_ID=MMETSP0173_2-20130828/2915_1 /ASSEMBLY_ACC=CAM_ASM_000268 /TAXON_ID=218659 /ORGANISM="Vexillifera sp., Strain DIVA3 564/2" /LENGTH=436 /DNA_ID=CAMNT_0047955339 /DNA_START=60 /DNA_END=1370 /DNA_ORIENTATION=+